MIVKIKVEAQAKLEEQSEETQKAISELLGGENE